MGLRAKCTGENPGGSDLLFVYGLLMRGFRLNTLMHAGYYLGAATTRGCLFWLGTYPGFVDGPGTVHGELYRFPNITVALKSIDPVEGFHQEDRRGSQYIRSLRRVFCSNYAQRPVHAWIYVFNQPFLDAPEINGGDFRTFSSFKEFPHHA